LGVLFYDTRKNFMRPAVWVRATDSLVFESSCGSGSAALGIWRTQDLLNGEETFDLPQPGGAIAVRIVKSGGELKAVFIGGRVGLSGRLAVSILTKKA
jgi:diaminopimelate epimerase